MNQILYSQNRISHYYSIHIPFISHIDTESPYYSSITIAIHIPYSIPYSINIPLPAWSKLGLPATVSVPAAEAESLELMHQHLVAAGGSTLDFEPMDRCLV